MGLGIKAIQVESLDGFLGRPEHARVETMQNRHLGSMPDNNRTVDVKGSDLVPHELLGGDRVKKLGVSSPSVTARNFPC